MNDYETTEFKLDHLNSKIYVLEDTLNVLKKHQEDIRNIIDRDVANMDKVLISIKQLFNRPGRF